MKVFASGSCRLLTTMKDGYGKVDMIHSMLGSLAGNNFLGKLHNTKQHIQLINFIRNNITIPPNILSKFLTSYSNKKHSYHGIPAQEAKEILEKEFDQAEWFIFEICSIKLYENDGFQVQAEITTEHVEREQTEEELLDDLKNIRNLISPWGKILFQVHFRPNVIHDNDSIIEAREMIHKTVMKFCQDNENTYIYDPSILLHSNIELFDGNVHFRELGHIESFNYIHDKYISKYFKLFN